QHRDKFARTGKRAQDQAAQQHGYGQRSQDAEQPTAIFAPELPGDGRSRGTEIHFPPFPPGPSMACVVFTVSLLWANRSRCVALNFSNCSGVRKTCARWAMRSLTCSSSRKWVWKFSSEK